MENYTTNGIEYNNPLSNKRGSRKWEGMAFANFGEQRQKLFASQKREDKASKLGQLYRHCISEALSIWDSMAVNNSKSTKKK